MRWADDDGRTGKPRCSIRIVKPAAERICPRCGQAFHASGPTGHADERPICGVCLLATDHGLGMAMAVLTLNRNAGLDVGPHNQDEEARQEALEQLRALAAIYAGFAAQYDHEPLPDREWPG